MSTRPHSEAEDLTQITVVPGALRRWYWLVIVIVCLYGGWVWFGNSGAGLLFLWCSAHRPWHVQPLTLRPAAATPGSVLIEPWRVSLEIAGVRLDIFRDEVAPRDWAWLLATLRLRGN